MITIETKPVSTNNMYAGRRVMTKLARTTKESIGWEARTQFHGEPLEGDLAIRVDIFSPDRRRRDFDNLKMVYDALSGVVWNDDSQIMEAHIKKHIDRDNPRIEISIL